MRVNGKILPVINRVESVNVGILPVMMGKYFREMGKYFQKMGKYYRLRRLEEGFKKVLRRV